MNNTKQIVFEVAVAFVPLPARPCDAVSANERGSNVVTTASNLVVSERQPSDVSVRSFVLEFAKPRRSITSPSPLRNAVRCDSRFPIFRRVRLAPNAPNAAM